MLVLFCILIKSQFNLLTINGQPASEFAGKGRPVFLRMVITGCPFAPPSVAQWEQAAKLFPQVDFVTYDCWKDNNAGVCDQFLEGNSSPYHVLIQPDKLIAYPSGFGNPPDISTSPQRFIDTITQNAGLYPIAPPILTLIPQTTTSFFNSSHFPIFLIYDSTRKDHSTFVSMWTKAANEELYPEDDSHSFGILDSSKYPNECLRIAQTDTLETPLCVVYSSSTHNYVKIRSYFSVIADVRKSISNLKLQSEVKPIPSPVPIEIPEKPTPSPIPDDFTIITNDQLEKRPLSVIKNNYIESMSYDGNSYSGSPADSQTCTQVTPSESDHSAALKALNFLRSLTGLTGDVVEDKSWSTDCQDTALIIHKIGTIPADHVVNPAKIPDTCNKESEFLKTVIDTAAKSNLAGNDHSCFESVGKFIKDEGENNRFVVGHRRQLFRQSLNKVGLGFYPLVK